MWVVLMQYVVVFKFIKVKGYFRFLSPTSALFRFYNSLLIFQEEPWCPSCSQRFASRTDLEEHLSLCLQGWISSWLRPLLWPQFRHFTYMQWEYKQITIRWIILFCGRFFVNDRSTCIHWMPIMNTYAQLCPFSSHQHTRHITWCHPFTAAICCNLFVPSSTTFFHVLAFAHHFYLSLMTTLVLAVHHDILTKPLLSSSFSLTRKLSYVHFCHSFEDILVANALSDSQVDFIHIFAVCVTTVSFYFTQTSVQFIWSANSFSFILCNPVIFLISSYSPDNLVCPGPFIVLSHNSYIFILELSDVSFQGHTF